MTSPSDWPDQPRMLLSYAYFAQWDVPTFQEHHRLGADMLIDSGAFTAATKGKTVNISEYTAWLKERGPYITHAASLDVIGDWRASSRNHDWQRAKLGDDFPLLPAWHLGSPLEELDRLCRENGYVAIGGCVPYARRPDLLMRHLIQAHRVAREHGTKLHGLGITGRQAMYRLPWASVDSSSYSGSVRFGSVALSDREGRFHSIAYGKKLTPEHRRLVRAYGGDPARVEDRSFALVKRAGKEQGGVDRTWTAEASMRAYIQVEPFLRRKHRSEFRLYLAMVDFYVPFTYRAWGAGEPFPVT